MKFVEFVSKGLGLTTDGSLAEMAKQHTERTEVKNALAADYADETDDFKAGGIETRIARRGTNSLFEVIRGIRVEGFGGRSLRSRGYWMGVIGCWDRAP
jgi:hypothetical protein